MWPFLSLSGILIALKIKTDREFILNCIKERLKDKNESVLFCSINNIGNLLFW